MLRMNMKLPVHKHLKRQLENEDLSFVSDSVLLIRTGAVGIVLGFFFFLVQGSTFFPSARLFPKAQVLFYS